MSTKSSLQSIETSNKTSEKNAFFDIVYIHKITHNSIRI